MKRLGEYKCDDFKRGDLVLYVPGHAHGDVNHPDIERGVVSSQNGKFVFVKNRVHIERFGWNGTTSQATDPADLVVVTQ